MIDINAQHNFFIAREGIIYCLLTLTISLFFFATGFEVIGTFFLLIAAFTLWFFRNPERKVPEEEGAIAPADGKIVEISKVMIDEITKEIYWKVSIFMNIFNVHVNRVPYSGQVKSIRYRKGKFLVANNKEASLLNEQNEIIIDIGEGDRIITVQIAGLIARRIVCWLKEGMEVKRGQRLGLICFGSRLDVFMPASFSLRIKLGQKVRAGETILGARK